jgi:hypothetical protein
MMSSDVEVLLKCLEIEWQDHFQTRIQTWRTLEIVAAIAVGLVGIDWRIGNRLATSAAALLLIVAAGFGVLITRRHRKVEREKFENIIEIEKKLKLPEFGLFKEAKPPAPIEWLDVINPQKSNTPLFILRMHFILMTFGIVYLIFSWTTGD